MSQNKKMRARHGRQISLRKDCMFSKQDQHRTKDLSPLILIQDPDCLSRHLTLNVSLKSSTKQLILINPHRHGDYWTVTCHVGNQHLIHRSIGFSKTQKERNFPVLTGLPRGIILHRRAMDARSLSMNPSVQGTLFCWGSWCLIQILYVLGQSVLITGYSCKCKPPSKGLIFQGYLQVGFPKTKGKERLHRDFMGILQEAERKPK